MPTSGKNAHARAHEQGQPQQVCCKVATDVIQSVPIQEQAGSRHTFSRLLLLLHPAVRNRPGVLTRRPNLEAAILLNNVDQY